MRNASVKTLVQKGVQNEQVNHLTETAMRNASVKTLVQKGVQNEQVNQL
jgi:hypothetical protein